MKKTILFLAALLLSTSAFAGVKLVCQDKKSKLMADMEIYHNTSRGGQSYRVMLELKDSSLATTYSENLGGNPKDGNIIFPDASRKSETAVLISASVMDPNQKAGSFEVSTHFDDYNSMVCDVVEKSID